MGFMIGCLIPMEGSWPSSDSRPRRSRSVSSRTSDLGTLRGFGASDTRLCGRLRQALGSLSHSEIPLWFRMESAETRCRIYMS
jgi:hypothetical protein